MTLSSRSESLAKSPSGIVAGHLKCLENPISDQNPEGYINFGTAENDLMSNEIVEKINTFSGLKNHDIHYCDLSGISELKEAFSNFAALNMDIKLNPECMVIQNGISSLCESLTYCLLDHGQKMLCFAPYYSGFDFDIQGRFKGVIIPVDTSFEDDYYHHIDKLDEAYQNNPDTRALLICHPNNPTGRILSDKEIRDIISWSKNKNIHLIVDEIYALSMIGPKKKFKSFLSSEFEKYENMHYLYGMAKDMGLGGFKVGYFHTENSELLARMKAISYFHCVGTPTQLMTAHILKDQEFVANFVIENQRRLKETFLKLQNEFSNFPMPESGLYCYPKINEKEIATFELLLHKFKINILPGQFFHDPNPGYFRICFAKTDTAMNQFIIRYKQFLDT